MTLIRLPQTDIYVNPAHVVYVEDKPPYSKGERDGQPRVEVCVTMYGRYRTIDVFNVTAAELVTLLNGAGA